MLVAGAADTAWAADTGLQTLPLNWRIGVEGIRLPGDENLDLVGASALLGLADNWFIGPAVYGAATGQRGGLFVIGAEALGAPKVRPAAGSKPA